MLEHHANPGSQPRQIGILRTDLDTFDFDAAGLIWLQSIDAFNQR
jgi:hypothetical protein